MQAFNSVWECPYIVCKCPYIVWECPYIVRECPYIACEHPYIVRECPYIVRECPYIVIKDLSLSSEFQSHQELSTSSHGLPHRTVFIYHVTRVQYTLRH